MFAGADQFCELGELLGAKLGAGVIGNKLPGPAFMPRRAAARAGSSTAPPRAVLGHGTTWGAGVCAPNLDALGCGVIAGSELIGGHVCIVSSGEP